MSQFLNPSAVMAQSGLMQGQVVADLGCGNGFLCFAVRPNDRPNRIGVRG